MKPFRLSIRQYSIWFFASAAAEAILCLVWLMVIPSDEKNAVIGRYSLARFSMGVLLLVAGVASGAAAWLDWKHPAMSKWIADRVDSRWAGWFALLFLAAGAMGIGILVIPAERFGESRYAFARLKPLFAWAGLVCLQTGLILTGSGAYRNRAYFAALQADARRSLAALPGLWQVVKMAAAGCLIGGTAALALSGPANIIFDQLPWLPGAGLLLGLLVILFGLFYTPSWVRLVPIAFIVLLLLGTTTNIWTAPDKAELARARIEHIPDDSAPALGSQFHYSLSVYHTLSILYPGSEIVATPELLAEWNLDEDRLRAWAHVTHILPGRQTANLDQVQADSILHQNPIEVEINTLEGTRYYYFLTGPAQDPVRLVLAQYERQRFILPEEAFTRLTGEQGEPP